MLQSLSIRNLAIIDQLDIEFGPGLTVLTGETGAGKSIILGALTLVLGGRAGAEMVRGGAARAVIDAVFNVGGEAGARVSEMGFELEEGRLYVSREVGAEGKSTARIAGRPSSISQLREAGELLVDLHGQHEHQSLLRVASHLDILDQWGGTDTSRLKAHVAEAFHLHRKLRQERELLDQDQRERARLMDLYEHQCREISEAALSPGEEVELRSEQKRLANAQRLAESAVEVSQAFSAETGGVLDILSSAARTLQEAAAIDDQLGPIAKSVESAMFALQEAARDLSRYPDRLEVEPGRLGEIDDRLDMLSSLKRKYGDTIEEILAYGRETADKLERIVHAEQRGSELTEDLLAAIERFQELCSRLSDKRRALAGEFSHSVASELRDLAMEKTRFEVVVEPADACADGTDKVEFMIAPNAGEPLRPLARIASGGEISRVMLAIKSAMARQDPLPTMVFDEIDVGIGGRTASVLGEKLAALAGHAQVICITHLPQIAALASAHFYIEKTEIAGRTVATVSALGPDERVEELARMLAGAAVTDTALRHAREMLKVG